MAGMTSITQERPLSLAGTLPVNPIQDFCAAGGREFGRQLRLESVTRSADGVWTVQFTGAEHHEGQAPFWATWSARDGFHHRDRRAPSDLFAEDLLGSPLGQEPVFFRRLEATYIAEVDQMHRDEATIRAQHRATGLRFTGPGGFYPELTDAWRNDDGSWSLHFRCTLDQENATYLISPGIGLVSIRAALSGYAEVSHHDTYGGDLLGMHFADPEMDLSDWVSETQRRYEVLGIS